MSARLGAHGPAIPAKLLCPKEHWRGGRALEEESHFQKKRIRRQVHRPPHQLEGRPKKNTLQKRKGKKMKCTRDGEYPRRGDRYLKHPRAGCIENCGFCGRKTIRKKGVLDRRPKMHRSQPAQRLVRRKEEGERKGGRGGKVRAADGEQESR